jgi:hypothetical protein
MGEAGKRMVGRSVEERRERLKGRKGERSYLNLSFDVKGTSSGTRKDYL